MTIKVNDTEYTFVATMKKIVDLNKKYKINNLREMFFKSANNCNFEFLAELLITFADDGTKKIINGDMNKVYQLLEDYVAENETDYESVYKLLAEEINDKSFFGKKMSAEMLENEMNNTLASLNIDQIISNATEKVVGETISDEFKGYTG